MSRPVALITGATRGIGRAIADDLARDHSLLLGGRDADAVAEACARYDDARPFACELTDVAAVEAAAAGIERLDVLVHNAGIVDQHTVAEASHEDWTRAFAVNVIAVADLTRALLPALRRSHGLVIAINSGAGYNSGKGYALYSGTKFALRAFTDALREEERGTVRVTSIHPGRVATDMQRHMWANLGQADDYRDEDHLEAADVAATVRLAVDADPRASIDSLTVRPAVGKNPQR